MVTAETLKFTSPLIVCGNQAADLDSVVSAYTLYSLLKAVNPRLDADFLIQGCYEDLRLKPEIKAAFAKANIPLTADDFDSRKFDQKKIILVDHNHPDQAGIENKVIGVVDHHKDEGRYKDLSLRRISVCGSCASLISSLWMESDFTEDIPYAVSLLLASAIAVDTGYLDPEWGKTTPLDEEAYHFHINRLSPVDQHFISTLLSIKNDLSHLNLGDFLERDYKTFPHKNMNAGSSSVPLSANQFFKDDFFSSEIISGFMKQKNLKFLLIIHSTNDPFTRELSFYTEDKFLEDQWLHILESISEAGFERQECPAGWKSFAQGNTHLSRKKLVPLFIEQIELQNQQ